MSFTVPAPEDEERRKSINDLLLRYGGLEAAILEATEQKDWDFVKQLKGLRADLYEKLRRVSYGLNEERPTPTKKQS